MNRNFGKLDAANAITYAPSVLRDGDTVNCSPNATDYAAQGWLPVVTDNQPTGKTGVYYTASGWTYNAAKTQIERTWEEHQITTPATVYVVEEIIYQLIAEEKLQATKAVVGDYWELLTMRERISDDNTYWSAAFPQVCAGLIAQGVFASQAEIDALLAKCREGYVDEDGRTVG